MKKIENVLPIKKRDKNILVSTRIGMEWIYNVNRDIKS